jgi:hypothetical protein
MKKGIADGSRVLIRYRTLSMRLGCHAAKASAASYPLASIGRADAYSPRPGHGERQSPPDEQMRALIGR